MTRSIRGAGLALVLTILPGQALAACPDRMPVVRGDTAASIARASRAA